MTNDADLIPDLDHEDAFEVQMRGYSRRQVDEFVARSRSQIRDLEERLSHALDELERLRLELSATRQGLSSKPAHEEISERVGQILKLADEEAKAQRGRAQDEIGKLRDDAKKEAERIRAEAREQTERMLNAAQEQAENAIATARAEAEKLRNAARIESERTVSEANKDAESTLTSAQAQAKQMLDEATMRASAIHDGAERRLNLLTSRHTETMRRLTEIRDVVTNLVASETARGSLEEEVAKSVASSFAASKTGAQAAGGRPASPAEARRQAAQPGRMTGPVPREAGAHEAGTGPRDAAAREAGKEGRPAAPAMPSGGQRPAGTGDRPQRPAGSDGDDRGAPAAKPAPGRTPPAGGPNRSGGENVRILPE
jgi:cell division septum initiation protein DivIVA